MMIEYWSVKKSSGIDCDGCRMSPRARRTCRRTRRASVARGTDCAQFRYEACACGGFRPTSLQAGERPPRCGLVCSRLASKPNVRISDTP
jgi:hypothetical protein